MQCNYGADRLSGWIPPSPKLQPRSPAPPPDQTHDPRTQKGLVSSPTSTTHHSFYDQTRPLSPLVKQPPVQRPSSKAFSPPGQWRQPGTVRSFLVIAHTSIYMSLSNSRLLSLPPSWHTHSIKSTCPTPSLAGLRYSLLPQQSAIPPVYSAYRPPFPPVYHDGREGSSPSADILRFSSSPRASCKVVGSPRSDASGVWTETKGSSTIFDGPAAVRINAGWFPRCASAVHPVPVIGPRAHLLSST